MNTYLQIFLIAALTGAGGLALGGALAAAVHGPSDHAVGLLLRFTAGVMLSVACFDLIPDAAGEAPLVPSLCWILGGWLCTCLLNLWIDKRAHHAHGGHGRGHGGPEEELCACGRHSLHTAGLVLAAAVALHNLPVGIAVGAAFAGGSHGEGVLAALIIGLHNIPEGMSIAAPMLAGGARRGGAVCAAALSGLPVILGALLGYGAGTVDPRLLAVSLCFAAGAMLYVVFGELLPESEQLWKSRLSGLAVMLGMLLGMALIFAHAH